MLHLSDCLPASVVTQALEMLVERRKDENAAAGTLDGLGRLHSMGSDFESILHTRMGQKGTKYRYLITNEDQDGMEQSRGSDGSTITKEKNLEKEWRAILPCSMRTIVKPSNYIG